MPAQTFKTIPNYDIFAYMPIEEMYESEIDGNRVTVAADGDNVLGVYYHTAGYGTSNYDFVGDLIEYVSADPHYPKEWG